MFSTPAIMPRAAVPVVRKIEFASGMPDPAPLIRVPGVRSIRDIGPETTSANYDALDPIRADLEPAAGTAPT